MGLPGFNHFLSSCPLGADQSRTDLCSLLGHFPGGTDTWLGFRIAGSQPQIPEDHGQITEGVWASRPSMPVCKVPSSLPRVSRYVVPCHPHDQQSMALLVPWMRKLSGRSCVLCSRSRWRQNPARCVLLGLGGLDGKTSQAPPRAPGCRNLVFTGSSPLG